MHILHVNSNCPRELGNHNCEELLGYKALTQIQEAESRTEWAEIGTTQKWIAMTPAQKLCRSATWDLHNLSLSQGSSDLLWIKPKPGLQTAELLNHYFSVSYEMFLGSWAQGAACAALSSPVLLCAAPEQLLRRCGSTPPWGWQFGDKVCLGKLLPLFLSGFGRLLFLLKSEFEVAKCRDRHGVYHSPCPHNCYGMQWAFAIGLD